LDSLKDLWPGQSQELLKALHILTRDGKLNQDSRRKLKQVQHLVQFLTPNLEGLKTVADLGAGKSYLGFMLYDLWMSSHPETELYAIESRAELIQRSREIASRSGFDRIHFIQGFIDQIDNEVSNQQAGLPSELDAITALHACDTATDDAIVFALQRKAKFIALVPCCQAEVARILDESNPSGFSTDTLWRHPIHRREFGSHLTNVIRGLVLEAHGYKVRVTELTGWEHSMKNELILAKKIQHQNGQAKNQLAKLLEEFPLPMRLLTRLSDLGLSPI